MKEAIGNSYIFSIIITFISIVFLILIGSLSYSKAFKIKNHIIEIIETNEGYDDATVGAEIDNYLKSVGYIVTKSQNRGQCPKVDGVTSINSRKNYDYCIYRFNTVKGPYYHVTVFISFEIPIVSSYLRIPVSGETRIIYEL